MIKFIARFVVYNWVLFMVAVTANINGRYTKSLRDYHLSIPHAITHDGEFLSFQLPRFYDHRIESYKERKKRSLYDSEMIHYGFSVGDQLFHLQLWPNRAFLHPNLVFEKRDPEINIKDRYVRTLKDKRLCHYTGRVKGIPKSRAAISTCDGLAGYLVVGNNTYFIEPVDDHSPNSEGHHLHVVYNKVPKDKTLSCGTHESWEDAMKKRFRSSLYYWAHYDFFNNTKLGEPIPGKKCDEVFASWKQTKGWLRSPLNTLVYKQQHSSEDVTCLYRFVSDKRLFARVILTITCVNFKDHPYNSGPCINCIEDRVDKLVIWEPLPPGANSSHTPTSLNKAMQSGDVTCICNRQSFSTQVISRGEHINLQLIVDSAHSALSYFKHLNPLFEATYEFVHGPLCGPAIIYPITDGEIHYPYYEAIGYVEPPKSIRCIWEIKINKDRDLWLHFDHIKFNSNSCDDGIVDIFLKGRIDPFLSLCGENVSLAKELPILSSGELSPDGSEPSITIQFIGRSSPTRAAFKIAWTELFHLPRNVDGTLMTSRLIEGGTSDELEECEFTCPGEQGLCIPARLVCNGIINCPNASDHKGFLYNDESPDVCTEVSSPKINWFYVGAATISVLLFMCGCCIFLCRKCFTDCSHRD